MKGGRRGKLLFCSQEWGSWLWAGLASGLRVRWGSFVQAQQEVEAGGSVEKREPEMRLALEHCATWSSPMHHGPHLPQFPHLSSRRKQPRTGVMGGIVDRVCLMWPVHGQCSGNGH